MEITSFYGAPKADGAAIYRKSLTTGEVVRLLFMPYGEFADVFIHPAVARGGYLLWGETRFYAPQGKITKTSLHLLKLDGSMDDKVLDSSEGPISAWTNADMSGDNVVWSYAQGDDADKKANVHLYSLKDGTTKIISKTFGFYPIISDNWIAWTETVPTPLGQPTHELLQVYNLADVSVKTVAEQKNAGYIFPTGIVGGSTLVYKLFDEGRQASDLYSINLK